MDEQPLAEEFFCAEKVENNRENMKTEHYPVIQHQYFGGADAAGPVWIFLIPSYFFPNA